MNTIPRLPVDQRGTVLAMVKAKPSGWPPASLDQACGPRQTATTGARR